MPLDPIFLFGAPLAWFKFLMFFVWLAAMVLSCWAWEVARMFARRMEKEAQRRAAGQEPDHIRRWPSVAVILPIKGVDADTPENLAALLAQQYPAFRLLFAVESETDPIVPLLRDLAAKTTVPLQIVTAGIATTRGQKVHNQLAAVAHTTDADEILVFMDADAHPADEWIRDLVRPLAQDGTGRPEYAPPPPAATASTTTGEVGATTGFRFYIPEPHAAAGKTSGPTLASSMVSVINAAVAALLGPGWRNIAWGGSMALYRRDFFSFGIQDAWQNALSDDYVLSWCVKNRAKRKIHFVQGCLVASAADFDWPAFWEFAARQYRITKVCACGVWLTAIGAAALYLTGLAYTLVFFLLSVLTIVPAQSLTGRIDFPLGIMFIALYTVNWLRGRFLIQGAIAGLPAHAAKLEQSRFWYTWGYPLTLAINLLALLKSAAGRTIDWRGIRYRMNSRLQTTVQRNT